LAPASGALDEFDLLASNFGVMFFGDPVPAFVHMRRAAWFRYSSYGQLV